MGSKLQDLREADVIGFRSWLKRNCTTDQGQKVLSSFHSILLEMKRRGIIADDPAQNVTIRSNARHKEPVKIPTIEEFQAILQAADRLANSKNNEIALAWERYRPMIYLNAIQLTNYTLYLLQYSPSSTTSTRGKPWSSSRRKSSLQRKNPS